MTTEATAVERLNSEFQEIIGCIDQANFSLRNAAEEMFRKTLLLAAASHFENEVKNHIMRIVLKHAGGAEVIREFIRNKAIERQFHTYFDWRARNANKFFGLFGEGFKSHMVSRVRSDPNLELAIRAFIEIGNERNRLVHEDFGNFPLEKTSGEIFELFRRASLFVDSLESTFDEYLEFKSRTQ